MKGVVVLVFVFAVAFVGLAFYVVTEAGGAKWVEDAWDDDSSGSSSSGDWGTEIEVEYEDGTNETLKSILPMKITYDGKDVSKFIYKLSAKGDSDELAICSIDLTEFWVDGVVTSSGATEWSASIEYGTTGELDLDNTWFEIYRLEIEAEDLESSLGDGDYKLEFAPSGKIFYRGDTGSDWVEVTDIPSDCWLNFDKEGYWIEITLEGGFGE